jgi:hypothetical protein
VLPSDLSFSINRTNSGQIEVKHKNKTSSMFGKDVLTSILILLVSGSLCLAVLDKDNHPAYFDIVKVAVGYAFGSLKQQGDSNNSDNSGDSDTPNDSDSLDKEDASSS